MIKGRLLPGREIAAAKKERAGAIARRLGEVYPNATCELDYRNPWELLVATILSAQSTDKMVNQVTPALFEEFPDPASLSRASQRRVEQLIHRTGFFRQKARSIRECARGVCAEFGGQVPANIDLLTSLQGVGRKTASVVLGTAFGQPAVFVDTHVKRLSRRLGFTSKSIPDKIEIDLKSLLPAADWTASCHRLIHHGRRVCHARKPNCELCAIADSCPKIGL